MNVPVNYIAPRNPGNTLASIQYALSLTPIDAVIISDPHDWDVAKSFSDHVLWATDPMELAKAMPGVYLILDDVEKLTGVYEDGTHEPVD